MKKVFGVCLAVVFVLTLSFTYAHAIWLPDGTKLSGKHYQFNIIGHPNEISGDSSGGRAVMISLDSVKNKNGGFEFICPDDTDARFVDDEEPTYTLEPAGGERIYFEPSDRFEIVDRDATDGEARILVPTTLGDNPLYNADLCLACGDLNGPEKDRCEDKYCSEMQDVIAVHVFVAVKGKPNTCMNINGFAYDDYQGLYFWTGRIELARKPGKATWVNVDGIFDVNWCEVDPASMACAGPSYELSVFNDVFDYYFWDLLNDGTRLVQVRLYPETPQDE